LLRLCQRLAAEGYAAIAPDLFFRAGGTEVGDFATLIGSLDRAKTRADIVTASDVLRREGAASVGGRVLRCGHLDRDRRAGLSHASHVGEKDEYIAPADIEVIRTRHPETVVYPDAGHGFMRDGSSSYDQAAALDAWSRMLRFFAEQLL
jgi:carboxymethylenebutenolidase